MTSWDGRGIDPWLPERLAAEATITKAERRMYQEWWGSFSAWLVTVHRSVLGSNVRPDASAVWAHAPLWAEKMQAFTQGPVRDTMGLAYEALFGKGYQFDSRAAVSAHLGQVHNRMVRTSEDVYDLVASAVARGAAAGQSIPTIAEAVDEILTATATERWPGRARTVARTETLGALGSGRADSFLAMQEELGIPMEQQWLCVAPDTPVATTTAVHAARRRYKGTLVRLTTVSGREIAVTPQHRVLTGRGWLPAQAVHQGDHLFQVVGTEPARAPHVQDVPAGIGELVDAAVEAEPVKVRTMPVAVDLDGESSHGQIQVVPVGRHLSLRLEASVPQGSEDLFLAHADSLAHLPLLTDGDVLPRLLAHGLPEQGCTSRRYAALLNGRVGAGVSQQQGSALGDLAVLPRRPDLAGRALVAQHYSRSLQDGDDCRPRAAKGSAYFVDRGAGTVHGNDGGRVDVVAAADCHAEALGGAGLFDRLGSIPEPPPDGLSRTEQDTVAGQHSADCGRTDRQAGGDLIGCFSGLVAAHDGVLIQRPAVVRGGVPARVTEDRRHALSADADRSGDGRGSLALIEEANDVGHHVMPAGPVLPGSRLVPQRDPRRDEALPERPASDAEVAAQLRDRCARLVAPDEVVDIDVTEYEGHVYDLSTGTGWYAADGLVIHNSTLDSRTRPSHTEADGQRVAVGSPFTVGGAQLDHPGDPFGPAEEIINCRCSMIILEPSEEVDLTGRGFSDWDTWNEAA